MAGVLIIGYGNPLRGDDSVGWRAAELLGRRLAPGVTVITRHQLLPELASPISDAGLVIFVDAAVGETPGHVSCVPVAADPSSLQPFTHQCNPSGLLAYAWQLYGRAPRAYLLTVTGASFGYVEKLSPAVIAALPKLVGRVQELLETFEHFALIETSKSERVCSLLD